jgi:hypothetical protein
MESVLLKSVLFILAIIFVLISESSLSLSNLLTLRLRQPTTTMTMMKAISKQQAAMLKKTPRQQAQVADRHKKTPIAIMS